MKKLLHVGLGAGVSVLLLWLAFRNVDWPVLRQELARLRWFYVFACFACAVAVQFTRVYRWGILIEPVARVSNAQLMRISLVGIMLITLLPLRLGEFARPYLLKRETGASMSAGLGSIAVERTIDGLMVTLLFFLTTYFLQAPFTVPTALRAAAYASLALFSVASVVIVAALLFGDRVPVLLRRIGTPISAGLTEKAVRMLGSFVSGLHAVKSARSLFFFGLYTLAYWAANGLGMYWMMLGFNWQLPPIAGFVVVSVLVLAIMLPSGPGMLGTFQAGLMMGLAVFGIGSTEAAAYGIVMYPLQLLVAVGTALPFMLNGSINLRQVVAAAEGEGAADAISAAR